MPLPRTTREGGSSCPPSLPAPSGESSAGDSGTADTIPSFRDGSLSPGCWRLVFLQLPAPCRVGPRLLELFGETDVCASAWCY